MESERSILKKCFTSHSNLWNSYVSTDEQINILYYPSAGEGLQPFLYSKIEFLQSLGLDTSANGWFEPDLLIFSDYFPYPESTFFDNPTLFSNEIMSVVIQEYCEIMPGAEFNYFFNHRHVHFDPIKTTGKAVFFRAKVTWHNQDLTFYKHAIYFFYENVNLIDQLFLKHRMAVTHLVWKRDGSSLGGGNVYHNFLYPAATIMNTQFLFLSDFYLDKNRESVNYDNMERKDFLPEIAKHLPSQFSLDLVKILNINWGDGDFVNLYKRVE